MMLASIEPSPCADPNCCGQHAPTELEDSRLGRLISENAALLAFRPRRQGAEAEGIYARCIAVDAA